MSLGILDAEVNAWRNARIEETSLDGDILFTGLIQDISQEERDSQGVVVVIQAVSVLGSQAEALVQEVSLVYSVLNGAHGKGSTSLATTSSSGALTGVAVATFSDTYAPAYVVQSSSGTTTTTATISPGLSSDIADATTILFSVPRLDTPANLLKRAFTTVLDFVGRLDLLNAASFDTLHAKQLLAGVSLWVFIREPDGITLGQYVSMIINATGCWITEDHDGTVSVADGPGWDGVNPLNDILDSDIVASGINLHYGGNQNGLYYGYNCLYVDGDTVLNQSRILGEGAPVVSQYGATQIFQPFPETSVAFLAGNKMLYGDVTSATYFGDKILDYYKYNRKRAELRVVATRTSLERRTFRQFSHALLTTTAGNLTFTNEPARIISLQLDEASNTYNLTLELDNRGYPDLSLPS